MECELFPGEKIVHFVQKESGSIINEEVRTNGEYFQRKLWGILISAVSLETDYYV